MEEQHWRTSIILIDGEALRVTEEVGEVLEIINKGSPSGFLELNENTSTYYCPEKTTKIYIHPDKILKIQIRWGD